MQSLLAVMPYLERGVSHADAAQEQLAASRVAAAWRLGQWEVLRGMVPSHLDLLEGDERWEVRLGKMLSAVHSRSAKTIESLLAPVLVSHIAIVRPAPAFLHWMLLTPGCASMLGSRSQRRLSLL